MIKIAIPGSGGRMGGMLIRAIATAPDLELVAATDLPDSPFIGRDAGEVAQIGANGVMIGSFPETLFGVADVVIDFTSPAASFHHASLAAAKGTAMVIGTTGLLSFFQPLQRLNLKNIYLLLQFLKVLQIKQIEK